MQPLKGWTGVPERLPDGFTMKTPEGVKTHVAVCEAWTNAAGYELRLIMDGQGSLTTAVVQSADEMRDLIETWRGVLRETGWR